MKLLLDTHVVLWWLAGHPRLGTDDRHLAARSECHVSAASIWEIAIKHRPGKLPVGPERVLAAVREHGMLSLPIRDGHAAATADLPHLHSDPFDRLLIAQARVERLVLLSADEAVRAYGDGTRHLR